MKLALGNEKISISENIVKVGSAKEYKVSGQFFYRVNEYALPVLVLNCDFQV